RLPPQPADALLDDELRMQRAGSLYRLQDIDHVVGRYPERVEPRDHFGERDRGLDKGKAGPRLLLDRGFGAGDDDGIAAGERIRLDDERRLLDPQREIALADRNTGNPHVLAEDDR